MYLRRLNGSHYEMGQKMGNIFKKSKAKSPVYLDSFQSEFGRESALLLKKYFTETEEEIRGKYGFICQYKKELNFDTNWSSVFDITGNRILRAEGNSRRSKYIQDRRLFA